MELILSGAPKIPPKKGRDVTERRRTMKGSRFSEEQIIGILREQEAGATTADVRSKHGISEATFYKWKAKFGGLEVSDP
jgi:putative transposase